MCARNNSEDINEYSCSQEGTDLEITAEDMSMEIAQLNDAKMIDDK